MLAAASNVNVDLGNNALIRAHLPTATPVRTIPQLTDLIGRVQSAGEILPVTTRTLNFRLLVRDGRGGTGIDDMQINVRKYRQCFQRDQPHQHRAGGRQHAKRGCGMLREQPTPNQLQRSGYCLQH